MVGLEQASFQIQSGSTAKAWPCGLSPGTLTARSNVFLQSVNSGNCSAYKSLIIPCSASWTLHTHWLVLSKNAGGPQAYFWSFFSAYFFPFWNFAGQFQPSPPRFLYPQLSKTLRLCLGSLFLCPWFKTCKHAGIWGDHILILFVSFPSGLTVCTVYCTILEANWYIHSYLS